MIHVPVLLQEVIRWLDPQQNQNFIDATLGEGGHARAILEKTGPHGMLLGIERDFEQIERAKKELSEFDKRVLYVDGSFGNLESIIKKTSTRRWQGIVFDLGWSQAQIEKSGRGFSFERDEPLDMRYQATPTYNLQLTTYNKSLTARYIINTWSKEDIESILREYGEEGFASRIARAIADERKQKPIETTFQLRDIIFKATPPWYHHRRIHPATKTFQALRIVVNDEYDQIRRGLEGAHDVLSKKGKIAVISFHSGEDRIVKRAFQKFQKEGRGAILTKKPIRPFIKEVKENPRARSAKLRVFQKV